MARSLAIPQDLSTPALLAAIDAALAAEIEAERQQAASHPVHVTNGVRVSAHDPHQVTVFRFARPPRARFRPEERVQCITDHVVTTGTIRRVEQKTVDLEIAGTFGDRIPALKIIQDSSWLTQSLRDRLRECRPPGAPTDWSEPWARAALVEGAHEVLPRPAELDAPTAELTQFGLNEEQITAVESALTRPLTVIFGPPGTGKTSTLGGVITSLVHHKRRILVVAPSNAAADVVLVQLHRWLADHPLIGRGLIQRIGPHVSDNLTPDLRALFIPWQIQERLKRGGNRVKQTLAEECAAFRQSGDTGQARICEQAIVDIDREQMALSAELERNRLITVAPIAQVWLAPALWTTYDVVVVDEATMVNPAALLAVAGLARERLVLAGDCQQLGPVTVTADRTARRWLATDPLTLAGIRDAFAREALPPHIILLRQQYRMPRAICDVVNEVFYMNQLRTVREPPTVDPLDLGPLVVVDTSGCVPKRHTQGRVNRTHYQLARAILNELEQDTRNGDLSIGVLTLYRDQEALYRPERQRHRQLVLAATVHKAQGSECDITILDLSDAPGQSLPFLGAASTMDDGARLLNVAITRARTALVIIANIDHLRRHGGAVVRAVLAQCEEAGVVVPASRFVTSLAATRALVRRPA